MRTSATIAVALSILMPLLRCTAAAGQAAQAPAVASRVIGEIVVLDEPSRQISVRTDKGEAITLVLSGSATLRRIRPGTTDLTQAASVTFSDLGVGDRILASVHPSGGNNHFEARSVVVMTRSDLAQKQQQEREEWHRRGISGSVSAIDPATGTITVRMGEKTVVVHASANTEFRRYAPGSVRFSDAQKSSLAQLQTGDFVRVLGDRSTDGVSMRAERMVSGHFVQIAATITSINPGAGELAVKDLASGKILTLKVNTGSTIRKLPPAVAEELARRYRAGSQGGGSGSAAGNGGEIAQVLDRLPPLPLSELKPGDAVMLSLTTGTDAEHPLAAMLLAGVEPLLTASPTATRDIMGGWNLGTASETP